MHWIEPLKKVSIHTRFVRNTELRAIVYKTILLLYVLNWCHVCAALLYPFFHLFIFLYIYSNSNCDLEDVIRRHRPMNAVLMKIPDPFKIGSSAMNNWQLMYALFYKIYDEWVDMMPRDLIFDENFSIR